MSRYEMVQFDDVHYGVRQEYWPGQLEYASPKYSLLRRKVIGISAWFRTEEFVVRNCFMSRKDAVTLLRLMREQECKLALEDKRYELLKTAVKNARVVSAES